MRARRGMIMLARLGKIGEFPLGKLDEHDEGTLMTAVGVEGGDVVIKFGKELLWVGLDRAGALELGDTLEKYADQAPVSERRNSWPGVKGGIKAHAVILHFDKTTDRLTMAPNMARIVAKRLRECVAQLPLSS